MRDIYATKIPEECNILLNECMEKIENITGKKYNLYIQEYGRNNTKIYSSVNTVKGPFIVSDMNKDYEILNGSYSNIDELNNKIIFLKYCDESDNICDFTKYFDDETFKSKVKDPFSHTNMKWKYVSVFADLNQIGIFSNDVITKIGNLYY